MEVMPQSPDHLTAAQLERQERRRAALGATVAHLRRSRGLTQKELAAKAGVSKRGVIRVETGASSLTLDLFGRFADALGVHPGEILRQAETALPPLPATPPEAATNTAPKSAPE